MGVYKLLCKAKEMAAENCLNGAHMLPLNACERKFIHMNVCVSVPMHVWGNQYIYNLHANANNAV